MASGMVRRPIRKIVVLWPVVILQLSLIASVASIFLSVTRYETKASLQAKNTPGTMRKINPIPTTRYTLNTILANKVLC